MRAMQRDDRLKKRWNIDTSKKRNYVPFRRKRRSLVFTRVDITTRRLWWRTIMNCLIMTSHYYERRVLGIKGFSRPGGGCSRLWAVLVFHTCRLLNKNLNKHGWFQQGKFLWIFISVVYWVHQQRILCKKTNLDFSLSFLNQFEINNFKNQNNRSLDDWIYLN